MADNEGASIASAAITSFGNYAAQAASNRKQFKFQKEAMALQQGYNKDMWDYQNAYNTPQAQMERLQAAGLNPRLMYGSGGAATGNAGPIASTDVPSRDAATLQLSDPMAKYLQVRQLDQQYAATTQNIENAKRKAALMEAQTGLENLKLMRESLKSRNYKALTKAELETAQFVALRSQELFANEKSKGNLMDQMHDHRAKMNPLTESGKKLQNEFDENRNELAKHGIYSSDHPAFRILIQASERLGVDLYDLLKNGVEYLLK